MLVSILNPHLIGDDKKGVPVYVSNIAKSSDLYDLGLLLCEHHICISVFRDNYRKGDNWLSADFLGVDFDDGNVSSLSIHEQLKAENINHIILASKNHLRDKSDGKGIIERFHVFIPFDDRMKEPSLYSSLLTNLCRMLKWHPDMATTKDKCRYYYRHREILHIYEEGRPLDLAMFVKLKATQDRMQNEQQERINRMREKLLTLTGKDKRSPLEVFKRTKYFRMLERGDCNTDGHRYEASNSIIGGMLKCGLDLSECLALFDKYANYGTGFTRDSVEHRFNKWR